MKKLLLLTLTATLLGAAPKISVILMIGDGMGPAYTSTYRYYKDNNETHKIEPTVFDNMLVGLNTTYSENSVITDSAAAATALATGYKTNNGFIGQTGRKSEQHTTVLEFAKKRGYLTAMAVTSTLTHATPAGFISKGHHRDNEAGIAKDFFRKNDEEKLKFDFLIGGGEKYFSEGYSDFNKTASENNVDIYRDGYNFKHIDTYPFIAFTAYDYPPFAIDESKENRYRVTKMTQKSLALLENKPFFLMIEGSQIDWCGHINDIGCAMAEIEDFSRAVKEAKIYVDRHPNTLLVVTADHSTGGLAIGKKIKKDDNSLSKEEKSRSYIWHKDILQGIAASSYKLCDMLKESKDINRTFKKYTAITLSKKEALKLETALAKDDKAIRNCINTIINTRSNTGWTTHGHTAVDVETFAYGKESEKFKGLLDNTDIAKILFDVLSDNK